MSAIALVPHVATTMLAPEETRQTLINSARRRFGAIPADALVDHVLRCTRGSDFAVREAALEALVRRWGFAQRDSLVVSRGPGALPKAPPSPATRDVEDGDSDGASAAAQTVLDDAAMADEVPPEMALPTGRGAGDGASKDGTSPSGAVKEAAENPVAALFDLVRVERTPDGGVRIEAPPEATGSLAALFQGMAQLLASATKMR